MKKFIILSGTIDIPTADDDGALNAFNFELVGSRACDTLEEAIVVRDQTIETDLADFQGLWVEEDGYSYDVGWMSGDWITNDKDVRNVDRYIDVYYNGEVINETIYKIREVEF